MSTVADTISAMQSQTAAYQQSSKDRTTGMTNDSNMFLTLMLQQLQNQDPTMVVTAGAVFFFRTDDTDESRIRRLYAVSFCFIY